MERDETISRLTNKPFALSSSKRSSPGARRTNRVPDTIWCFPAFLLAADRRPQTFSPQSPAPSSQPLRSHPPLPHRNLQHLEIGGVEAGGAGASAEGAFV